MAFSLSIIESCNYNLEQMTATEEQQPTPYATVFVAAFYGKIHDALRDGMHHQTAAQLSTNIKS